MKSFFTSLSLLALLSFNSCGAEGAMSAEGLFGKGATVFEQVTEKLGTVKDKATAETADKMISPMLDKLKGSTEMLSKIGKPAELLKNIAPMASKFGGMKEKLMGMVSGGNEFVKPLAEKAMNALKSFTGM